MNLAVTREERESQKIYQTPLATQEILATREREVANEKKLLPDTMPLLHVAV